METDTDSRVIPLEVLNEQLAKSARLSTYTTVKVLILFWQGEDEGFKEEGLQLGEFFETTFQYTVEQFEIPKIASYLKLHQFITRESLDLSSRSNKANEASLLIVHYGGHGDRNDRKNEGEEKRAVWASDAQASILIPWYRIQEDLDNLEVDLLLLFDCCFAAQAGRAPLHRLGKVELLAAAAMGMTTPKPGDKSFTVALMKEALGLHKESGFVAIKDLHARLMKRTARLHATPIHVNLRAGRRSIRLEPLTAKGSSGTAEDLDTPLISLVLRTREELGRLDLQEFVQWLGVNRPRDVDSVMIVETTSHIQRFVEDFECRKTPLVKAVRDVSLDDIKNAWDNVVSMVEQCSFLRHRSDFGSQLLRSRAQKVLKELDATNHEFLETLERSVIVVNNREDMNIVENAINDPVVKSLGVTNALRLRQIIYSNQEFSNELGGEKNVMTPHASVQEEKRYDGHYSKEEKEVLQTRIRHLAMLLSARKGAGFQTLQCYRCEHKIFERRYILHFEVPLPYINQPDEKITLTDLIEKTKGSTRPTLEERLGIALRLVKAVYKWHSAGWLHQGISSPNIRFFRREDNGRIDFTCPFIMGFDFARPDSDSSLGIPTNDPSYDIYRHPSRQGPARQGHRKVHDYYSLGVVLLEIGLWQGAAKMVANRNAACKRRGTKELLDWENLQADVSERLAHFAGTAYQEAVKRCLSSHFEVDFDDESESRLLKQFYEKVVMNIARGIMIQ